MMKKNLLIIGASGHGKVVADIALKMKQWESIAFLDDNESIETSMGLKIIGPTNDIGKYINEYEIFVGIGNNTIRENINETLEKTGASIPILIHPSAIVGADVEIGIGTVIMARAVINCCSVIGKGCIVNTGATIDHDNCIGDFAHISPGAHLAGTVNVGQRSWLGIGSIVSNNVSISKECTIGAGAVVVRNITNPGIYVGVPVRRV